MGARANPAAGRPREVAVQVVRTLRGAGHVAYFAGGCVRDELLGLEPADYDVATDATPDRVSSLFRRTAHVGAHFGVVVVKAEPVAGQPPGWNDCIVEVATFRSDGAYSDRRRPDSVTFSDAQADAQRRDFTVNALFLDPLAGSLGQTTPIRAQVVDFVGGLADLDARVLRAVGDPDARLAEDHLRALRAVRLSARLGFAIEGRTGDAIRRHARDLEGISRERVGDEIRRILNHPTRGVGIATLQALGLDLPVLGNPKPVAATTRLNGVPATADLGVCLAALAIDRQDVLGRPGISALLSQWRSTLCLSNDDRDGAHRVLNLYFYVKQEFMTGSVAQQKRAAAATGFEGAMTLIKIEDQSMAAVIERRVAELAETASGIAPTPLVNGDDLIAAGMAPGPGFAKLLARLYDAQLEDAFASRAEGVALARRLTWA